LSARQNNAKRTVIAIVAVVELREVQNSIANIIIIRDVKNEREGEVRTFKNMTCGRAQNVNFQRRKNILT